MWTTIALGVASSIAAEVIVWLNKKFNGTVLQGLGAFVLATFIAFVGAMVKIAFQTNVTSIDWATLASYFSQVFTVSQVWFYVIVQKLGLDVKPDQVTG